ncbi:hypothetical protein OG607_29020 [Streptomyces sp. NBC_01537]|uniref:hypothetical protein n=1 Tax=Streptomyces sp. NBC_01537 TaxID=2903896 RepID=UPI00386CB0EA
MPETVGLLSSETRSEEVAQKYSKNWRSTATIAGLRITIAGGAVSASYGPASMEGTTARLWSVMIIRIGRVVAVRTCAPSRIRSFRCSLTCGAAADVARWMVRIATPRWSAWRLSELPPRSRSGGSGRPGNIDRVSNLALRDPSSRIAAIWAGWTATSIRPSASCRKCSGWKSVTTWANALCARLTLAMSSSVVRLLASSM